MNDLVTDMNIYSVPGKGTVLAVCCGWSVLSTLWASIPLVFLTGEVHCKSKVAWPRTQKKTDTGQNFQGTSIRHHSGIKFLVVPNLQPTNHFLTLSLTLLSLSTSIKVVFVVAVKLLYVQISACRRHPMGIYCTGQQDIWICFGIQLMWSYSTMVCWSLHTYWIDDLPRWVTRACQQQQIGQKNTSWI